MKKIGLILGFVFVLCSLSFTKGNIELPEPDTMGGKPLMQVLNERKSTREFSEKSISKKVFSNMLWAAFGINREDSGKRTAPSAMNYQEIDIYVSTKKGLYLYNAEEHRLELILKKDIRALTGLQKFVADAPLNIIYVADASRAKYENQKNKQIYTAFDTGFIAQNVYLFCASVGLNTVIRGYVDKKSLAKAMKLNENQHIVAAQTVGYPKD